MVMDYSEKRTVREGLERKPVQKNRPRKDAGGLFVLLSIAVLLVTFGTGVATGWFLFKGTHKAPAAAVVAQPVKKEEPAAAPQQAPAPETPLTFYNTLPAGGKAAMGSGLNLKKPQAAHPAPASAPASAPAAAPAAAAAGSQPHYTVQIASYRDKKEAETAQSKMTAKGVAAYLVESKVPDKGVWYRLRVGKNLSKAEADELAGKSDKGAIVLPE